MTRTIMEDFLSVHFDAILGFFTGIFAGGFGVHLYKKKNSDNTNINHVNTGGGDFAGRDIHKK